jgi:mannose-6-phosphate isomerase, type 2 (EC 5.3.1.8)
VSISDSDRSPELDYLATVHHGIDLGEFEPTTETGTTWWILGRIHPDKGTAEAIEIARRAGRRLIICGPVVDARYFAEQVEPFLDDERVVHLGSIGPEERSRVLGASAVLLHPIHFAEPFGLAVIEAMACGTPVVAYRRARWPSSSTRASPASPSWMPRPPSTPCPGRPNSTGRPCVPSPNAVSAWSGWPTTTSPSTSGCWIGDASQIAMALTAPPRRPGVECGTWESGTSN